MPRSRKAPATSRWATVGHGDGDGVDPVEQVAVVGEGRGPARLGDGPALLGPGVDDADELDVGQRGEDPGVMPAQVPDPDDADSQAIHDFLQRSRARPCLPACWASTKSRSRWTSGSRWPCDSRISAACLAFILAR